MGGELVCLVSSLFIVLDLVYSVEYSLCYTHGLVLRCLGHLMSDFERKTYSTCFFQTVFVFVVDFLHVCLLVC